MAVDQEKRYEISALHDVDITAKGSVDEPVRCDTQHLSADDSARVIERCVDVEVKKEEAAEAVRGNPVVRELLKVPL